MINYVMRKLGELNFEDGKIIVADPCYFQSEEPYTAKIDIALGVYEVYQKTEDNQKKFHIDRIKALTIIKKDSWLNPDYRERDSETIVRGLYVDSGQMSIVKEAFYPKLKEDVWNYNDSDKFYGKCCDITLKGYDYMAKWYELLKILEKIEETIEDEKDDNKRKMLLEQLEDSKNKLKELENKAVPYLQWWLIDNIWVVSSTADGDGYYGVKGTLNEKKEIIAIDIIF